MPRCGTQLYVSEEELEAQRLRAQELRAHELSAQDLNASKAAPKGYAEPHVDNRLRLPWKLSKADLAREKVKAGRKDAGSEAKDADLPLESGSPWRRYREILALLDLGDKVVVARERNTHANRVNIRRYPMDDKEEERLAWFRNLRHANIVSVLQLFSAKKILYVVLEPMQLPINHLIRCPWQLSADEVGTIMGQVSRRDLATTPSVVSP